jgi:hypothetical protein
MEPINYTALNEQAKFLYDGAHRQGYNDGESVGRNTSSRDHGIDKLNAIIDICRLGQNISVEFDEPNETARVLAALARKWLGGIPLFNATAAIDRARNALAAEGFKADFNEAIRHCDHAKSLLSDLKFDN